MGASAPKIGAARGIGPRVKNQGEIHMTDETGGLPSAAVASALATATLLSACGGGDQDQQPSSSASANGRASAASLNVFNTGTLPSDFWRFLDQASMGPTEANAAEVQSLGYQGWLDAQFNKVLAVEETYDYNYAQNTGILASNGVAQLDRQDETFAKYGKREDQYNITGIWLERVINGKDQLRQRVTFALSQILVVSLENGFLADSPRSVANYMDILASNAFGSFRTLIEAVCKSPCMGVYLTHLGNRGAAPGRIPDQNFARELLQLFTLGLDELNMDGTPVLDADGEPVPTLGKDDVATLSHVFTGWAMPANSNVSQMKPYDHYFAGRSTLEGVPVREEGLAFGNSPRLSSDWRWCAPMEGNPTFHAKKSDLPTGVRKVFTSTDTLLGLTPQQSLTNALNVIFAHKNLAPFIAKQMIQRLVTSNPPAQYVKDVATHFKDNAWSLKELIKAVLLHPHARDAALAKSQPTYGKVREPVLRLTHLLRVYGKLPTGATTRYVSPVLWGSAVPRVVPGGANPPDGYAFYQGPFMSPSVFNFYPPSFPLPLQKNGDARLVAPEMKLITDSSAAGYINAMYDVLDGGLRGFGSTGRAEIDLSSLIAIATSKPTGNTAQLTLTLRTQLLGTTAGTKLRSALAAVCQAVNPTDQVEAAKRVKAAILLILCSPEYIVQK
ncbi:MAG: DUF1800 family protein [Rubrivivax sp.]|nr:MAG: DUF1800 family protein [Rubrivivax sp.]